MCIMCLELDKMTFPQTVNRLGDFAEQIGEDHLQEVYFLLLQELWENAGSEEFMQNNGGQKMVDRAVRQLFKIFHGENMFDS